MSQSPESTSEFTNTAWTFAALCEAAIERQALSSINDQDLSRALVAAIRLFAAKAQEGQTPELVSGNHVISATDGAIFATAILEAVGIEVFELAAWQACSNIGSNRSNNQHPKE
jgi:hypothetical protein